MLFNLFGSAFIFSAILFFVLGLLAFIDNPKDRNKQIFFIHALSLFFWIISLYLGYLLADQGFYAAAETSFRFSYAFSILGMGSMTAFLYSFPNIYVTFRKAAINVFIYFSLLLALVSLLTPWILDSLQIEDGVYIADNLGSLYFIYSLLILFNLFIAAYLGVKKLRNTSGIEKRKLQLAFFGYISEVTIIVAINVIFPIFGFFMLQRFSILFTFLFIVPSYYALHRYRFFNLSVITYKVLRKLLLLSGFIFVAYSFSLFLQDFLGGAGYIIGILLGLVFYDSANDQFPSVISKTYKEFQNGIRELKSEIISADTHEKLQKAVEDILVIRLNMTKAWICAIRSKNINNHFLVHLRDEFSEKLKDFTKDILILEEIPYLRISKKAKKVLKQGMESIGCKICLPLSSGGNAIGFLAINYRDDINVSRETISEIQSLQLLLSVSFMNLLLKFNLQEENDLMKAIINKKTKLLKEKYKEIKELLRQQSDFIAITSHEIRTPLNVALLQTDDLIQSSRLTYSECEELSIVSKSLEKLKNFVQRLFDVQQYEFKKAKLQLERFALSDFMRGVFKELKPVLSDKHLKLKLVDHVKKHRRIIADPSQLKQVLSNLISNASRFSERGGIILLETETDDSSFIIKVIDNGPGIPNNKKKTIFKKFRTQKGTGGLGLYICKKIVDLHKGEIWAEDNPEGGSVFAVSIPLK